MIIQKLVPMPKYNEAVLLTYGNMFEVAAWSGGTATGDVVILDRVDGSVVHAHPEEHYVVRVTQDDKTWFYPYERDYIEKRFHSIETIRWEAGEST